MIILDQSDYFPLLALERLKTLVKHRMFLNSTCYIEFNVKYRHKRNKLGAQFRVFKLNY